MNIMIILDSNGMRIRRTVVFDVETTGLSPEAGDRVIELGAVALKEKIIVDEFHSLISVDRPIHPDAQRIHRITNKMLSGQPRPEQVIPEFHAFIKDSILVAHNANFDMRFISSELARLKLGFRNACFCTMMIGRNMFPELPRHNLETMYELFYK